MRTVGQILKEERERKFYTIDEVEKTTKIRKELLEALEAGQYQKLPPSTFVQGFIKNYGKFLELNVEKLLAVFRREFSQAQHPPRVLDSFSNPVEKRRIKITPTRALSFVILTLVVIFFAYLWFEYRFLVGAPFLMVDQPVDQLNTASIEITVSGRTDPEAKIKINEQEIGVDQNGKFSQPIKLSENMNNIVVSAISKRGKETRIQRTVFLRK